MYVYCIFAYVHIREYRVIIRLRSSFRFNNGFIQTLGFLEFLRFVIYSKIKGYWFSVLENKSVSSMRTFLIRRKQSVFLKM